MNNLNTATKASNKTASEIFFLQWWSLDNQENISLISNWKKEVKQYLNEIDAKYEVTANYKLNDEIDRIKLLQLLIEIENEKSEYRKILLIISWRKKMKAHFEEYAYIC